jgi:hypothetical protein
MRLTHALHNETVCNYLFADARFSDWVITAAFYSALHFVHHELFPGTFDGLRHNSFEAYCFYLSKKKRTKRSNTSANTQSPCNSCAAISDSTRNTTGFTVTV